MASNKETDNKAVTKYDRKMEERKKKEAQNKKEQTTAKVIGIIVAVVIVAAIAVTIGLNISKKNKAVNGAFITVGEHEVNKVEYDFYYNTLVSNYLNSYGSMISYLGLDTSKDYAQQQYNDELTWKDFFDAMAVQQVLEVKACKDDALAKGFEYDTAEDYANFETGFAEAAKAADSSVSDYYVKAFGEYATADRLESIIKDELYVEAYLASLVDENMPTSEEIAAYYEENKKDYDDVDYRLYLISEGTKEDADKIADDIKSGMEFQAAVDAFEGNEASDEDSHLITDMTYGMISSVYSDWLFDEGRQAEDIETFEDAENNRFYVVQFVERREPEDMETTIGSNLSAEVVREYKSGLTSQYELKDVQGTLNPVVFEQGIN